jgi:hypothetical protein
MDAADIAALDAAESSFAARTSSATATGTAIGTGGVNGGLVNGANGDGVASGKKKMRITCKSMLS